MCDGHVHRDVGGTVMFDFFKKKQPQGSQLHLTITGMHCTSCAMNIDGVLEETDGVLTAQTSYARAEVKITYDPLKISKEDILQTLQQFEYTFRESSQ